MSVEIIIGDCREVLKSIPDESVQCCVTSPPYWGLRDYGCDGQIGLEGTIDEFITKLVAVFEEVRRVLKKDGTCWVNMGDAYAGSLGAQGRGGAPSDKSTLQGNGHIGGGPKISQLSKAQFEAAPKDRLTDSITRTPGLKPKDLIGQPWMLAFALRAAGWYLRSDIIWHKPNPMPESTKDRPTKAHEYLFLLTKSERYYYDHLAIAEPVTGNAHRRGEGVNPKAMDRPKGWADSGNHTAVDWARQESQGRGGNPSSYNGSDFRKGKKAIVKVPGTSAPGAGDRKPTLKAKQNESFSSSVTELVESRNKRSVWTVPTFAFPDAHFATYPPPTNQALHSRRQQDRRHDSRPVRRQRNNGHGRSRTRAQGDPLRTQPGICRDRPASNQRHAGTRLLTLCTS